MMWQMAFPVDDFIARFKVFADKDQMVILDAGQRAMFHTTPDVPGMPLHGPYREYALFLMTAHLLTLDEMDDSDKDDGGSPNFAGVPFKATVGNVQVETSKQNSFTSDDWNYWLNQTKYGRELLAYLESKAIGIFLNTPDDTVRDLL